MPPADQLPQIQDLSQPELVKLVPDFIHRIIIHYGMWFHEIHHQMGIDFALECLGNVFEKDLGIQMSRLGQILGFEVRDGLPAALAKLPKEKLIELIDGIAKNWVASDGIWFQAVEFKHGMNDAKRCNDSCWAHFSPFEAWAIKRYLDLGKAPGLEGMAKALNFRAYARLNTQSIIREGDNALIFQMNACRVQVARQRKGLQDYPCKSAGMVEYTYFARFIDPRIKTECIGCPPDAHPQEWFCAWKFFMD
jgi:hypothetical protein